SYVRSHFDAMEVYVQDAPRANEIIYGLVMTTGGRIHPRVGGLETHQISDNDGLR
ncbi:MAG: amino acid synthesis family protein, partial [SAR324 cluster bacterium]|nr:amino acid synthesis family protein [SAR324 cluster bacterium]